MTVRVRFAPSPTGHLHIGGARTALYNWLYARQCGGVFILRVEDTDRERSTTAFTESILEGMRWLGLTWDEGPFFQTERMDLYKSHVQQLLDAGKAYRCYCTPERLEQVRKDAMAAGQKPTYDRKCRNDPPATQHDQPFCLRFKAPLEGTTIVHDMVRGDVAFDNKELDDLVIARTDGTPTYNFTVVVDDVTMDITHVIRGDDHLNNSPRQILMYQALGYATPIFAHLPMILGADRQRLSKRHGATSVIAYRDMGYLPDALLNYLARLGWSHADQEIFTLEEMVKAFSFDHVGKASAIFDPEKLNWVSTEHLKKYSNEALAELVIPFLQQMGLAITDRTFAVRAITSERERGKTLRALAEAAAFYFRTEPAWDDTAVAKWLTDDGKAKLRDIAEALRSLPTWTHDTIKAALDAVVAKHQCKFVALAQPIRVALTGTTVSPGIYDVLDILGKDQALQRIESALSR